MEMITYVMLFLLLVYWCSIKWNRRHIDKLAAKLKGPPAYPIIGNGHLYFGTSQQIMERLIQLSHDYGPEPFKVWLGPYFAVTLIRPEDIQVVLNSSKALEKAMFYKFFKGSVGEGLFTAPVEKWKKHRRVISPVFNSKLMEQFFPVFNEKNKILINNLKKELGKTQHFDLWEYISSTALDIICQTAMGYNLDTQSNSESEFADAVTKLSELEAMRIYKPWLHPNIIYSIYEKVTGLNKLNKKLHKLPNQVIKEMKELYNKKKSEKEDNAIDDTNDNKNRLKVFLDTLLELEKSGVNFTNEELKDEVVTMMIGGSETSAITICFCLLLLAMHPDIQDKVYNEIYYVLGNDDKTITIEDTTKLVYLEQVLKETLRLYPIGPVILRELQDDVKIVSGDITIPKGTICAISPIGTHHCPEWYPNPWAFNPDNFNPENVAKRHRYSFIAFSGGPRGCIGSKYAILSMKVLVSMVLRNYSLHTDYKLSDIKLKVDLLMRSVEGYPVTIRPRIRRPTHERN